MKEKVIAIIKICIIIVIMIGALIFKFIPEYKASQGSSDTFIDTKTYQDIIEFKINNQHNFAIVTGKKQILNILFFDKTSICLYNQDIEKKKIEEGISQIVEILIEHNYLKENSFLTIIKYNGVDYDKVKNYIQKEFSSLGLNINILEQSSSIEEKSAKLNITDGGDLLKQIELYSKDIVRHAKKGNILTSPSPTEITEQQIRTYTDTIYKKIEVYARKNNITTQGITRDQLLITSIPANEAGTIYADENSWYYIENGKVYAYISITIDNENYSYCYQASIDEYKKGQC